MTDLTDVQRRELLRIADMEDVGGLYVPYVSRAHHGLSDAGLVKAISDTLNPQMVRCTSEGLRVAERLRDEEAES